MAELTLTVDAAAFQAASEEFVVLFDRGVGVPPGIMSRVAALTPDGVSEFKRGPDGGFQLHPGAALSAIIRDLRKIREARRTEWHDLRC